MATTLRDTLKGILGSAWHTAHDAFFSALTPASDGTVEANKFIAPDSNKDVTGLRNLTVTGTITGTFAGGVSGGAVTPAAGTATVAPIVLTAGTNLTTAAAGAVEYDGTAFYATAVASSRQQLDAEQYTIANADSATYNNTGLDASTAAPVFTATMGGSANGAITLVAGKTYAFEAEYVLTNTGTTSHTWATLFGGTATFTQILYSLLGVSGTASAPAAGLLLGSAAVATAVVATAASTSATENVTIKIKGSLIVNAGGTLIPQMQASARPGASGTPGVVVKKGSFFRIWEMGGAGTLGNWS